MGHITCKSMGRVFGVVRRYDYMLTTWWSISPSWWTSGTRR